MEDFPASYVSLQECSFNVFFALGVSSHEHVAYTSRTRPEFPRSHNTHTPWMQVSCQFVGFLNPQVLGLLGDTKLKLSINSMILPTYPS